MAAGDAEVAVGTLGPGSGGEQALGDLRVVLGALDRVGDRGQDEVGSGSLQMLDGGLQVHLLFTFVTEHDEHADLDAAGLQHRSLVCTSSTVVSRAMRSRMRCEPLSLPIHSRTTHGSQGVGNLLVEAVGAGDALEGGDRPRDRSSAASAGSTAG